MANSSVDFPQPDSPTIATNSPGCTCRSTPSTARTAPFSVANSTLRPETSSSGALDTPPPHRSQGRVADLVECVVEQREGGTQRRYAQPGCDHPPHLVGLQCLVALGPVEHRAPAHR